MKIVPIMLALFSMLLAMFQITVPPKRNITLAQMSQFAHD